MKQTEKWHKKRHVFYYHLSRVLFRLYAKGKLRYRGEKFDNRARPYLFLYNHQTPYDQHLLYLSVPHQPYAVATEDIFTLGFLSKVIRHTQAPVPFKKSMNDIGAVMTCFRIAREGCSLALSPEGNRTFTGTTVTIKPSIVKLIKALKLPVAIFLVRGGYDVLPRYADKPRRAGRVTGRITSVLEYSEYKDMSNEALYEWIRRELYVDESDDGVRIRSNRRAEYLERAVYRCPLCGAIGQLKSEGSNISCKACGTVGRMDEYKRFQPDFPVRTVKEWIESQEAWINALPVSEGEEKPVFAEQVKLQRLMQKEMKRKVLAKNVEARLFTDRIEVGNICWHFSEVDAMTVCGRFCLNFYVGGITYKLTADKRFCAVKYVNLYYHYKNTKENGDGFLGI